MKISQTLQIFLGQASFSYVNSAIGLSWYALYSYDELGSVFKLLVFPTFLWALFRMRTNLLFASDENHEPYDVSSYFVLVSLLGLKLVLVLCAGLAFYVTMGLSAFSLLLLFLLSQASIGLVSQAIYTKAIGPKVILFVNVLRVILVLLVCFTLPFSDALQVFFLANFIIGSVFAIWILSRFDMAMLDRERTKTDLKNIYQSVKMSALTSPTKESDLLIVSTIFNDDGFAQYKLLRSIGGLSSVPSQIIQGIMFRGRRLLRLWERFILGSFSVGFFASLLALVLLFKGLDLPVIIVSLFAVLALVSTMWPDLISLYQKFNRFEDFTATLVKFSLTATFTMWALYFFGIADPAVYLAIAVTYWMSSHLFLFLRILPHGRT